MIVRVQLPINPNEQQAYVSTQDGAISMMVPVQHVSRRFRGSEFVAFFHAFVKQGVLEIDDRIEDKVNW